MDYEKAIHSSSSLTPADLATITIKDKALSRLALGKVFTPEEGLEWAKTVVTEEVLEKVFAEVCGKLFLLFDLIFNSS